MKIICSALRPFPFIFEILPLGNCIFHVKYYWTWTLAGHDEHFSIGQGQICSTVCHRQSGMIKIYLSELLTTKGKSSAFGFGECVWFTSAVKIQAAMKKTLKSLDDRSGFIAVLCMLFYSVISKLLCNRSSAFSAGILKNIRSHKMMIFMNESFPNEIFPVSLH